MRRVAFHATVHIEPLGSDALVRIMKNTTLISSSNCPSCGHKLDSSSNQPTTCATQELGVWPLSFRERQLVDLVRQAKSNKEIAFEMTLTVGSVKEYLYRVFKKLGVRSRTELALLPSDRIGEQTSEVIS